MLWSIADSGGPFAEQACALVMRRLDVREARARLEGLGAAADHARTAIAGAAALGDPALVPWLLASMATPALARVAGEAFATHHRRDDRRVARGRARRRASAPARATIRPTTCVAVDRDGPLAWPADAGAASLVERARERLSPGLALPRRRAVDAVNAGGRRRPREPAAPRRGRDRALDAAARAARSPRCGRASGRRGER